MGNEASVAIIGAAGACGRQLAAQLLERAVIEATGRLQLIGHHGGASEHELHGLRADLRDAFSDDAPSIEIAAEPAAVDADVIVMLAGQTLPADPTAELDRSLLGRHNRAVFVEYAQALTDRDPAPWVIVQSNPVEVGVAAFTEALGRERVVGAGAHSDMLRFRRELADSIGVRRPAVDARVGGQHGDHLVPLWSSIRVHGHPDDATREATERFRGGRALAALPGEIAALRTRLTRRIAHGEIDEAFEELSQAPPDLRAAVKPFLVHCTAGHTTEIHTAYAVAELVTHLLTDQPIATCLQVAVDGEYAGLQGIGGIPVVLERSGWRADPTVGISDDEQRALHDAFAAISTVITGLQTPPER